MSNLIEELRECDPSINESKPATAFVDLASFNNIESALYGGKNSITYFVRETVKCAWFTLIPIKLQLDQVNPDFGQSFSAKVSKDGDYLLNTWLRVSLGNVPVYNPSSWTNPNTNGDETILWTPNFMHNLVERCSMKVNDMTVDELFSEHLDFLAAFMVPKSHRIGYNRMIGNFNTPYNGLGGINVASYDINPDNSDGFVNVNRQQELFLPLPFFFSKDTAVSLPVHTLPYVDITFEFKFRNWKNLLASISRDGTIHTVDKNQITDSNGVYNDPKLENVQVWGTYAVVTQNERQKIGCNKRDIVIEQNKQLGGCYGSSLLNTDSIKATTSVDLRFDGAIKALFFSARNTRGPSDLPYRSNYTTYTPRAEYEPLLKLTVNRVKDYQTVVTVNNPSGYNSASNVKIINVSNNPSTYFKPGEHLADIDGNLIGYVKNVSSNSIEFTDNILTNLTHAENLYKRIEYKIENSTTTNSTDTTFEINNFNRQFNDSSGLVWDKDPTDPFATVKLLYNNDIRMEMESLYYSLIQPHQHARNVPESSSMKGTLSIRNPNEVSGQPALSVGYHTYSYALKIKNIDPCGTSNLSMIDNSTLVFTPSQSAYDRKNIQGPWRIFISALTQNVIRISNGGLSFPIM